MDKVINKAIKDIYIEKNYDTFRSKCKEEYTLPREIEEYIYEKGYQWIESTDNQDPSITWYCTYDKFTKGEFEVLYKTILKVSKLVPAYYIQHEFEVENKDINGIEPVLDGFGGQPYTKDQFEFDEVIKKILEDRGYKEISFAEMNEVITDIKMPIEDSILGKQITVEHLLFHDMFELCDNSCID